MEPPTAPQQFLFWGQPTPHPPHLLHPWLKARPLSAPTPACGLPGSPLTGDSPSFSPNSLLLSCVLGASRGR